MKRYTPDKEEPEDKKIDHLFKLLKQVHKLKDVKRKLCEKEIYQLQDTFKNSTIFYKNKVIVFF